VQATQKAWLKYRDAWVALGAARYPHVSSEAWMTWTTRKRTAQLKEVLEQMSDDVRIHQKAEP
jgi:uncharacterized protein YecT (DUF1311 family)